MNTVVRALAPDESNAFRLARLVAAEMMPYFMSALFAASPVAAPGLGTFAVDGAWRLYLDPECLVGTTAWSSRDAAAVLVHEIGHLIRDHDGRARALPADYPALWNFAADAEINDDLLAAGVPLPGGPITPAALGQADNDIAENYYAALLAKGAGSNDSLDDGGPGCGSGAGMPTSPWESIPVGDRALPGISAEEGDLVRRTVAVAVREHAAAKGRGTVPAGLQRWSEDVLRPPSVPWQQVLRATVRRAIHTAAGATDYTYRRPSRRRVPGLVLPAMQGQSVLVSIVVDTSGSMSASALTAALSEIQGVLNAPGIDRDRLLVMSCDAESGTPQRISTVDAIDLVGGGGTDMTVGIEQAESFTPPPHVVIVLTDGYTPWPDSPTRARLICALIGDTPPETPVWATTVHVPET